MKYWRVGVAFFFTLFVLVFSRKTTTVRSVHKVVEKEGLRIEHTTIPKQVGDEIPVISAKVKGASEVRLFYKIGKEGEYRSQKMTPQLAEKDLFVATLPHYPKATKAWYFIEAIRQEEKGDVKVTLPDRGSSDFNPIRLKYEGEVPPFVIFSHVLCNFGAIFFSVLSLFSAIDVKKGRRTLRKSIKFPILTFVLMFLGFVPFGFAMNYFAFGTLWEAFPFGKDVTDNKAQVAILSWLITLFLVKGTLWGKGSHKNLISDRGYFRLVVVAFIITLAMYAIPHSL